jgi:hypothetical protein
MNPYASPAYVNKKPPCGKLKWRILATLIVVYVLVAVLERKLNLSQEFQERAAMAVNNLDEGQLQYAAKILEFFVGRGP